MLKFKTFKKFFAIVFCAVCLTGCTSAPQGSFSDVYDAASAGDREYLMELKSEGVRMDMTDENGDTPLCVALKNKDRVAYDTLRSVGASRNIRCKVVQTGASTSSLPPDYAYGTTQTDLLLYTPDHNPPQKQYPKTTNNSVITGTILTVAAITGIVLLVIWL